MCKLMGYMTDGLTFNTLRQANIKRIPTFKNSKGELCHNEDGSDWSINDWFTALTGEFGEFANVAKKFKRGDITEDEFRAFAAQELPDIQIYLDILAFRCGIDLGRATISKFNEVSNRVDSPIFIVVDGSDYIVRNQNQ